MSRRNTNDPLLRAFLDTYKVNLLAIPRANVEVGDCYVAGTDGNMSLPGKLRFLLMPDIQMPHVVKDEKMASIGGKRTRGIDFDIGISLLEGLLSAVNAGFDIGRVKQEYKQKRIHKIRFQLKDATRDSIDPFEFGLALIPCRLNSAHPFVQEGSRYYAVVGVLRSDSITVSAEDRNSNIIGLGIDAVMHAVRANGKLSVKREASGDLTYAGSVPLAFGVELVEMRYEKEQSKFVLDGIADPKVVRTHREGKERRVFVGDPETGDIFLPLK